MSQINILGKQGYLTEEDRKHPLVHNCEHFVFHTNLDLSEPIKVVPYGFLNDGELIHCKAEIYSNNVASFMVWWSNFVSEGLNGFSGFHNIKWELIGFKIV